MEYRVVIPSRQRSEVVKATLTLLPGATVVVREDEGETYREAVGAFGTVVTLPGTFSGYIPHIRNWILDHFTEETVIMVDDDLQGVVCLVGQRARLIKEPQAIQSIFESTLRVAKDLGVSFFYYNRDPNPMYFQCCEPFSFCGGFGAGAFGIIGRKYRFDERLTTREDIDYTLQCLLHDRIVFTDKRFYFNFGGVWRGSGGNQGIRLPENEKRDEEYIAHKWGGCIRLGVTKERKGGIKNITGAKNQVKRKAL